MSYSALENLGIKRPHEISGYTLSSHNDVDTLRIKYTRQKGSLLPTAKRFQFPRRPLPGIQTAPGQAVMTEVSPALESALVELAALLDKNVTTEDKKATLMNEMNEFEEYVAAQIKAFKIEIGNL